MEHEVHVATTKIAVAALASDITRRCSGLWQLGEHRIRFRMAIAHRRSQDLATWISTARSSIVRSPERSRSWLMRIIGGSLTTGESGA